MMLDMNKDRMWMRIAGVLILAFLLFLLDLLVDGVYNEVEQIWYSIQEGMNIL